MKGVRSHFKSPKWLQSPFLPQTTPITGTQPPRSISRRLIHEIHDAQKLVADVIRLGFLFHESQVFDGGRQLFHVSFVKPGSSQLLLGAVDDLPVELVKRDVEIRSDFRYADAEMLLDLADEYRLVVPETVRGILNSFTYRSQLIDRLYI